MYGLVRVIVLRVVSTYTSVACSPHNLATACMSSCRVDVYPWPCVYFFFLVCLVFLARGGFPKLFRPHTRPGQECVGCTCSRGNDIWAGCLCGPTSTHVCVGGVRAGFVSVWPVLVEECEPESGGGRASGRFNSGASPMVLHAEGGSLCVVLFQRVDAT